MTDNNQTQASNYVDLGNNVYTTYVNAYAQANQRLLGYGKSLFEILTRPYTSNTPELTYRENFDRAQQILDLTVSEMQAAGQHLSSVVEELVAQNTKLQQNSLESSRGMVRTFISNLNYVKETTDQQFEGITKRVEDIQARTGVSAN